MKALGLNGIEFGAEPQLAADSPVLMLGRAGTIPAATSADCADFLVIVPYNLKLTRMKASAKTAPSADTTIQVRRSTNSGASFADAFGTVVISSAAKVGVADPSDLDVDENDVLNISITGGGGSGSNLAVQLIGRRR